MSCLNDAQIQAVADGEGTPGERDHVRGCSACAARVAEVDNAMRRFGQAMSALPVPPGLGTRMRTAARPEHVQGATTLRPQTPAGPRRAWLVAAGAAAAALIAWLFVLFPSVDSQTTLRAAEILDRSLQALSRHGVERLEYELTIDAGNAAALGAGGSVAVGAGRYRVDQLIDHETGRWRLARYAPDGTLLNGIAENPAAGTREAVIRHEGRVLRFEFAIGEGDRVALWDAQRRWAESMIRLVRASGGQIVREETVGDAHRFSVELPDAGGASASAGFDLHHARVVVDAADYHIVEFAVGGVALGEPVSIGYRLIQRDVVEAIEPDSTFALTAPDADAGAVIVRRGRGTRDIPGDLVSLLLRELGRSPEPR